MLDYWKLWKVWYMRSLDKSASLWWNLTGQTALSDPKAGAGLGAGGGGHEETVNTKF